MEELRLRVSRTWIRPRSPATVLVASVLTCGFYQLFWYHHIYDEIESLFERTPTGNSYWMDLLLTVISCGIYGIYVDYLMCNQLNAGLAELGHRANKDEGTVVVVLDVSAYVTGWMSNLVTTALAQDQMNKLLNGPLTPRKPPSPPETTALSQP